MLHCRVASLDSFVLHNIEQNLYKFKPIVIIIIQMVSLLVKISAVVTTGMLMIGKTGDGLV